MTTDGARGSSSREAWLARVFPELADTLVDDFDVVDFLSTLADRTVELLGAAGVGLMLVQSDGALRVMASSTESMRDIELFELQSEEGPCHDALVSGTQIVNVDLEVIDRWPRFTPRARTAGYRMVHALPMRLRETRIGVMNVFHTDATQLSEIDVSLAQAFADVATIGLLHRRAGDDLTQLAENLQHALDSRVAIEQAKGFVSHHLAIDVNEAFARLRAYARHENRRLAEVAHDITTRRLPPSVLRHLPPNALHRHGREVNRERR